MDALQQLLGQTARPSGAAPEAGLRPAIVTRSDAGGVFVTPLGTATASPLGPCRAATFRREVGVTTTVQGVPVQTGYRYVITPLPKGTAVLVANTEAGPWIVRHDLG